MISGFNWILLIEKYCKFLNLKIQPAIDIHLKQVREIEKSYSSISATKNGHQLEADAIITAKMLLDTAPGCLQTEHIVKELGNEYCCS